MATATTGKITRDDLEAKLRAMSGDLDDTVEAAKPTIITSAAAGLVLAMLVAYLLGRRRGRARSAVVEIRKI
jgi:membrane protein DedA with SNARE-associated domain